MPHVDFLCWGAALLDAPFDVLRSPANLVLNEPFLSYDELPLEDSDLWLYTSAYEGMPTILIELAMRGVAVVASMVGGIPELLDHTTGYPVHDVSDVGAYVSAIAEALRNPAERVARAAALQRAAVARHTKAAYHAQLGAALDQEG